MALDTLRKGVARTLGLILVFLLVISFAVWGIADIFTGYGRQTLIQVGDTEINQQGYLRAQQEVLRTMSQQAGRSLSLQEARAAGLDTRVLERLIVGASVDTHAKHLGLDISDDTILAQIKGDPAFQDGSGNFSPLALDTALRNIGMSEAEYFYLLREQILRQQMLVTVGEVTGIPQALIDALNQFNEERRVLKYVLIPKSAAEAVGDPSDQDLKTYYENNKAKFTQPEYRKVGMIAVTPETVKDALNITDAEIRADYESKKETLGEPERRSLQQIALPSTEEARKALEKIRSGTDFADVAKELGLSDTDIDLGTVARSELADAVVAEEAFKLEKDAVSEPVTGKLGSVVLIRVVEIEPGKIPTYEEAKEGLETEILKDRASGAIFDMHDQVEDKLASGATLEEAASKLELDYEIVDQVDREGRKPDGTAIAWPAQKDLLNGIFATDAGIENDPIDARDEGVVWYEVLGVIPEQLKPLDQVRDELEEGWRSEATRNQVAKFTQELVAQLNSGAKTLDDVAKDLDTEILPTSAMKRDDITVNVLPAAVSQAFALPKGGFGSAISGVDEGRIVFQLDEIIAPPEVDERALKQVKGRIGLLLGEDTIAEYIRALETRYGVRVNQQALANLVGNSEAP